MASICCDGDRARVSSLLRTLQQSSVEAGGSQSLPWTNVLPVPPATHSLIPCTVLPYPRTLRYPGGSSRLSHGALSQQALEAFSAYPDGSTRATKQAVHPKLEQENASSSLATASYRDFLRSTETRAPALPPIAPPADQGMGTHSGHARLGWARSIVAKTDLAPSSARRSREPKPSRSGRSRVMGLNYDRASAFWGL